MSVKTVQNLIAEGKYKAALVESQKISPAVDLVFQSKVAELTGHFDDALNLGKRAMNESKNPSERVASAIVQAYAFWRLFMFDEGHKILDEVKILLDDKTVSSSSWHGTYHNIRGLLLWKADKLNQALDSFNRALVLRKEYGTYSSVGYTTNNLGNTFLKMGDDIKAETEFNKAREIRNELNHNPGLAASANSFGRLEDNRGQHDMALKHHQECLRLWKKVGNTQFIGKAHRFLALNAALRNDEKALHDHFKKSDEVFQEIGNDTDLQTNKRLRKKEF